MVKKEKKAVALKLPKFPFSIKDRGSFIHSPFVVVGGSRGKLEALRYSFARGYIDRVEILKNQLSSGWQEKATQYYLDGEATSGGAHFLAKTHLQWLRRRAVEGGATPEAIRLLARSTEPFTKEEVSDMANKLARGNKASAAEDETENGEAAPAKRGRKAKADKPVGGGGKLGKKGGNTEALKKAREAAASNRAAMQEKRITLNVKKSDDLKLRGGRREKLMYVLSEKPKTVGDIVGQEFEGEDGENYTIDLGALRGMERRGHITIED